MKDPKGVKVAALLSEIGSMVRQHDNAPLFWELILVTHNPFASRPRGTAHALSPRHFPNVGDTGDTL